MPSAADFEKLGVFYLGRPYDWQQKKAQDGEKLMNDEQKANSAANEKTFRRKRAA